MYNKSMTENGQSLKLNGKALFAMRSNPKKTIHQMVREAGVSNATGYRMLGEKCIHIQELNLENFSNLMIKGIGLSPEELMNLKLSDIFTLDPPENGV